MRKLKAVLVALAAIFVASLAIPSVHLGVVTVAKADPYNPFDCSKRWGSNSSACSTGGGGRGRGGGGGGRR